MTDREVEKIFAEAKRAKFSRPFIIECIICEGSGCVIDAKTQKIRGCAGCKGTGEMKNPNYKHQQA